MTVTVCIHREGSCKTGEGVALAASLRRGPCLQLRLNSPIASSANDCAWGAAKRQRLGATFGFASPPASGEGRPTLDGGPDLRGGRGALVGEARLRRRGEATTATIVAMRTMTSS